MAHLFGHHWMRTGFDRIENGMKINLTYDVLQFFTSLCGSIGGSVTSYVQLFNQQSLQWISDAEVKIHFVLLDAILDIETPQM